MTVSVTALPGVQPFNVKSNRPCGNAVPAGGAMGGDAALPLTAMNWRVPNPQLAPPPEIATEIVPLAVAETAL